MTLINAAVAATIATPVSQKSLAAFRSGPSGIRKPTCAWPSTSWATGPAIRSGLDPDSLRVDARSILTAGTQNIPAPGLSRFSHPMAAPPSQETSSLDPLHYSEIGITRTVSIGATSWPVSCRVSSMLRCAPRPCLWSELPGNADFRSGGSVQPIFCPALRPRASISPLDTSFCRTARQKILCINPHRSPWQQGRRYAGDYACNTCGPCAEFSCTNW